MENIPSLAGQPEFFVLNQLFLMREGVRQIEVMTPFVKDLKDDGPRRAGDAFLPSSRPRRATSRSIRRWSSAAPSSRRRVRCASCHLPTLAGQEQMPRLAKQRVDYLIHSMKEFRDNTRSGADTAMSDVVAGLSDADLTALAHYAASR